MADGTPANNPISNLGDQFKNVLSEHDNQIASLRTEHDALEKKVKGIVVPTPHFQKQWAYQQAADWVRMVNTITWTLFSIYLVSAVIALNGASQPGVDVAWRRTIAISVLVLCIVWGVVDWVYDVTLQAARKQLEKMEEGWDEENQFFTGQRKNPSIRIVEGRLIIVLIYAPMVLIGLVAIFIALRGIVFWDWPLPVPLEVIVKQLPG
jgi:hypothetical protein